VKPVATEYLSLEVRRLQNLQREEQNRRKAKAELASIEYRIGGHSDEEYQALHAELVDKVRCGRSVVHAFTARGATE